MTDNQDYIKPDLPALAKDGWPTLEKGWVWLVGGGRAIGLLTLHALNALRQADVIVYDALVDEHILQWADPAAEIEYAGKRGGSHLLCSAIFQCA